MGEEMGVRQIHANLDVTSEHRHGHEAHGEPRRTHLPDETLGGGRGGPCHLFLPLTKSLTTFHLSIFTISLPKFHQSGQESPTLALASFRVSAFALVGTRAIKRHQTQRMTSITAATPIKQTQGQNDRHRQQWHAKLATIMAVMSNISIKARRQLQKSALLYTIAYEIVSFGRRFN